MHVTHVKLFQPSLWSLLKPNQLALLPNCDHFTTHIRPLLQMKIFNAVRLCWFTFEPPKGNSTFLCVIDRKCSRLKVRLFSFSSLTEKLHFWGASSPFSAQSAQRPWMMRVSSVCIGSSMYRPHGLFPNTQIVQQSGGVNQSGGGSRHMKSVSSWR